jgi:hypothetical protein
MTDDRESLKSLYSDTHAPNVGIMPRYIEEWEIKERELACEHCADRCNVIFDPNRACFRCQKRRFLADPNWSCPRDIFTKVPAVKLPFAIRDNLNIALVIPSKDEGPEIAATVKSAIESILRPGNLLGICVIDDGSRDNSCDPGNFPKDVHIIRNEEPKGTAYSQNLGLDYVLECGADVIVFTDAHMRFRPGLLETLAIKAMDMKAIAIPRIRGMGDKSDCGGACTLFWEPQLGIAAGWGIYPIDETGWAQCQAPMGGCYVFSTKAIDVLRQPTGALWDNVAGLWGYQEEGIAFKAILLGIPIYLLGVGVEHAFSKAKGGLTEHKIMNACLTLAEIFHPKIYSVHFQAIFEKMLGGEKEGLIREIAESTITRSWSIEQEEALLWSVQHKL